VDDRRETRQADRQAIWTPGMQAWNLERIISCLQLFPLASFLSFTLRSISMNIVFANTKGGVGKSTLAVHLAVWLFDRGAKVALLDLDKQRSSSTWIAQAEPQITVRTSDSPENCASEVRALARNHDFVVGDGPAGLDDVSRTLLILADLALLPITPSILDLWSVKQASSILRFAQEINDGRPLGLLVLNKMRKRDRISEELKKAAPGLGMNVAGSVIRDLQAYRDAAQQGNVVTRMSKKAQNAAEEVDKAFSELIREVAGKQTIKRLTKEVING
jgi:chromosome partitioning protein